MTHTLTSASHATSIVNAQKSCFWLFLGSKQSIPRLRNTRHFVRFATSCRLAGETPWTPPAIRSAIAGQARERTESPAAGAGEKGRG